MVTIDKRRGCARDAKGSGRDEEGTGHVRETERIGRKPRGPQDCEAGYAVRRGRVRVGAGACGFRVTVCQTANYALPENRATYAVKRPTVT